MRRSNPRRSTLRDRPSSEGDELPAPPRDVAARSQHDPEGAHHDGRQSGGRFQRGHVTRDCVAPQQTSSLYRLKNGKPAPCTSSTSSPAASSTARSASGRVVPAVADVAVERGAGAAGNRDDHGAARRDVLHRGPERTARDRRRARGPRCTPRGRPSRAAPAGVVRLGQQVELDEAGVGHLDLRPPDTFGGQLDADQLGVRPVRGASRRAGRPGRFRCRATRCGSPARSDERRG